MRDFPGANCLPLLCVIALFQLPTARAGILETLQKWVLSGFEHYVFVSLCNPGVPPIFFNGSNT